MVADPLSASRQILFQLCSSPFTLMVPAFKLALLQFFKFFILLMIIFDHIAIGLVINRGLSNGQLSAWVLQFYTNFAFIVFYDFVYPGFRGDRFAGQPHLSLARIARIVLILQHLSSDLLLHHEVDRLPQRKPLIPPKSDDNLEFQLIDHLLQLLNGLHSIDVLLLFESLFDPPCEGEDGLGTIWGECDPVPPIVLV
jgi:hypothetical protein